MLTKKYGPGCGPHKLPNSRLNENSERRAPQNQTSHLPRGLAKPASERHEPRKFPNSNSIEDTRGFHRPRRAVPLVDGLAASVAIPPSHAQQKKNMSLKDTGSSAKTNGLRTVTRPKHPKKLGTVEDLARRWRMSPKTIANNLSSGRLKLGTKNSWPHPFDITEVLQYERANRTTNRTRKNNAETTSGGDI